MPAVKYNLSAPEDLANTWTISFFDKVGGKYSLVGRRLRFVLQAAEGAAESPVIDYDEVTNPTKLHVRIPRTEGRFILNLSATDLNLTAGTTYYYAITDENRDNQILLRGEFTIEAGFAPAS